MSDPSPEGLFAAVLASQPSLPLVTYYNDVSGEWAELSARSAANWVAKTHFLLTDELGLGVGDAAFINLPAHWISVPILFGCWSAGLTIVSSPERAAVAFIEPAAAARVTGLPDVFAIAPASPARGFDDGLPAGVQDYVAAVRPQPDAWGSVHYLGTPGDPAIDGLSRADVVAAARSRAGDLGLPPGSRVLSARVWAGADDWIDTVLAPLAVGGSIVLVGDPDPAKHDDHVRQERVTAVV